MSPRSRWRHGQGGVPGDQSIGLIERVVGAQIAVAEPCHGDLLGRGTLDRHLGLDRLVAVEIHHTKGQRAMLDRRRALQQGHEVSVGGCADADRLGREIDAEALAVSMPRYISKTW